MFVLLLAFDDADEGEDEFDVAELTNALRVVKFDDEEEEELELEDILLGWLKSICCIYLGLFSMTASSTFSAALTSRLSRSSALLLL